MSMKGQVTKKGGIRTAECCNPFQLQKGSERRSSRNSAGPRNKQDKLCLERMSTTEFHALIGEGPECDAVDDNTVLNKEKRKQEKIREQGLHVINDRIVGQRNINSEAELEDKLDDNTSPSKMNREEYNGSTSGNNCSKDQDKITISSAKSIKPTADGNVMHSKQPAKVFPFIDMARPGSSQNLSDAIQPEGIVGNHAHTQTVDVAVFCVCSRCIDLLHKFHSLLLQATSEACMCSSPLKRMSNCDEGGIKKWSSSVLNNEDNVFSSDVGREEVDGQVLVPLLQGCKIKIPLTKKSNLKIKVTSGDPKDFVNELMEIFFTPGEMANMTAEGRTPGSTKMNPDIKDAILAYVSVKYDRKLFNFDKKLLNDMINSKCYCERRKLWNKSQTEPGAATTVRQPLLKKKASTAEGEIMSKKRANKTIHRPSRFKNHRSSLRNDYSPKLSSTPTSRKVLHNHASPAISTPVKAFSRATTGGKRPKKFFISPIKSSYNDGEGSTSIEGGSIKSCGDGNRRMESSSSKCTKRPMICDDEFTSDKPSRNLRELAIDEFDGAYSNNDVVQSKSKKQGQEASITHHKINHFKEFKKFHGYEQHKEERPRSTKSLESGNDIHLELKKKSYIHELHLEGRKLQGSSHSRRNQGAELNDTVRMSGSESCNSD